MTVYAITDTKKGEQGLRLLIFKLPRIVYTLYSFCPTYRSTCCCMHYAAESRLLVNCSGCLAAANLSR